MKLRTLGMIMAGGKGTRLAPLTNERAKPAVPFGGKYRIVDFVLSNFINSGILSLYVLTQFKAQSLLQHLSDGWQFTNPLRNQFIIPVPAQMRAGETWYQGTADAIFQNVNLIEQSEPDLVAVFGADHIYYMDIRQMIAYHVHKGAATTVAALPVPREDATEFGVMELNDEWRVTAFHEKPKDPIAIPGRPDEALISMGNYIFDRRILVRELYRNAQNPETGSDFGHDILPSMLREYPVYAYDFRTNDVPGLPEENRGYWRDVGTIDAYWETSMDLRAIHPALNLYNSEWPVHTATYNDPPAKFALDEEGRRGQALNSIVSEGCIISGATVVRSVLGKNVFVHSYAHIEDSVIMDGCDIARGCRIRRAILDRNVRVPPDTHIGYNLEDDRKRYFVTDNGIAVLAGVRSQVPVSSIVL